RSSSTINTDIDLDDGPGAGVDSVPAARCPPAACAAPEDGSDCCDCCDCCDPADDDFKAASPGAGAGESHVGSDVTSQGLADRQSHAESLGSVSFIIVHLVKLVEEERNVGLRNSDAGVADADDRRVHGIVVRG